MKNGRKRLLVLRGLLGFGAVSSYYWTVQYLPLVSVQQWVQHRACPMLAALVLACHNVCWATGAGRAATASAAPPAPPNRSGQALAREPLSLSPPKQKTLQGDTAVLMFLAPLFVAALSPLLLRELPSRGVWAAIPLCTLGVVLVVQPSIFFGGSSAALSALGVGLGVLQVRWGGVGCYQEGCGAGQGAPGSPGLWLGGWACHVEGPGGLPYRPKLCPAVTSVGLGLQYQYRRSAAQRRRGPPWLPSRPAPARAPAAAICCATLRRPAPCPQAVFSAAAKIVIRLLGSTEPVLAIVAAMAAVSITLSSLACALLPRHFVVPRDAATWLLLLATGLLGFG